MILLKNTQKTIKINKKLLEENAQKILNLLQLSDFDLSILLTNNKTIQKYNKIYRNQDKPTDILSFAYHTNLKAGEPILIASEEDKNLGDLVISLEYIKENVPKYDQTLEERLKILLVHGICHLIGYDHETDSDYKTMQKKERFLLKNLE